MGKGEQWDLPRAAAFAVGIVVELVKNDIVNAGAAALAQGHVGENLGGAAEDGGVVVDGAVTRGKADVIRPELTAKGQPLFVDQGLDRAGVNRTAALGEGLELERESDQRLTRARWGIEDDVAFLEQFQDGGFLSGVEFQVRGGDVIQKTSQQEVVGGNVSGAGQQVVKGSAHQGRKDEW